MFFSAENINREYLREKFDVYDVYRESSYMCGYTLSRDKKSLMPLIKLSDPKHCKEFLSSQYFRGIINNLRPANTLQNLEISETKLYDSYFHYAYMGMPYTLEETDLENIHSGKALLRVNNGIIYTVSKSGDWYIFKNFSPVKGTFGHERNTVKLLLRSIWCVKKLPNILSFNTIIPNVTTMNDIINIDPSFRYFEENGTRYSTHTFTDKEGSRISIEYKKDERGIFRVSKIAKVSEGWNLLPYLLPVDRKLIDPNYEEAAEETTAIDEKSGCTIT